MSIKCVIMGIIEVTVTYRAGVKKGQGRLMKWIKYFLLLTFLWCGMLSLTGCSVWMTGEREYSEKSRYGAGQREWEATGGQALESGNGQETGAQQEETESDFTDVPVFSDYHYAYDTLTEEEKQVYEELLWVFYRQEAEHPMSTSMDVDWIAKAYSCIRADHPEIFWEDGYRLTGYERNGEITELHIIPVYPISREEREAIQPQLDQYVEDCLAGIPEGADDFQKICHVYEYIIENTSYNLDAPHNQTVYSTFVGRESVCQGYAYGFQYILLKLGIGCTTITGEAVEQGSHAWNMVRMEDGYYFVDTTWGDPEYETDSEQEGERKEGPPTYKYFMMTSQEADELYQADEPFVIPESASETYQYFRYTGHYMETYDPRLITGWIGDMLREGRTSFQFQTQTQEVFEEAREDLITQLEVYKYLRQAVRDNGLDISIPRNVTYSATEDRRILWFEFPFDNFPPS